MVNLLALNIRIRRKGFKDVKPIGIWDLRGSLKKSEGEETKDAFQLATQWRMDYTDIDLLSDAEPFEENKHDRAVKAQMAALGITNTRFITVPDPDDEFNERGVHEREDDLDENEAGIQE